MSLFSELQSASSEMQSVIAQMQGMDADATGNFTYQDNPFIGVFGRAVVERMPIGGGGYRQRAVIPLTVTRDQTGFTPAPQKQLVRLSPRETYIIDRIDEHDPLVLVVFLVKFGA